MKTDFRGVIYESIFWNGNLGGQINAIHVASIPNSSVVQRYLFEDIEV